MIYPKELNSANPDTCIDIFIDYHKRIMSCTNSMHKSLKFMLINCLNINAEKSFNEAEGLRRTQLPLRLSWFSDIFEGVDCWGLSAGVPVSGWVLVSVGELASVGESVSTASVCSVFLKVCKYCM